MIGLIRADDLDRWAARITSAPEFPRLVRRLVHFTARELQHVDFPADEAIRLAGWDGKVLANEGTPFVPAGFSVWELGTNQDPRAKANDDYGKRTANPLGVDPLQATFIFVTPRRWAARDAWATEKRREGKWKDARAFDAESLAQWLACAPRGPLQCSAQANSRSPPQHALVRWLPSLNSLSAFSSVTLDTYLSTVILRK